MAIYIPIICNSLWLISAKRTIACFARAFRSEQNLTHAAAYFDSKALHSLINASDSLAVVTNEQIIQQLNDSVDYPAADEMNYCNSKKTQA